jgi:hypothetical protein
LIQPLKGEEPADVLATIDAIVPAIVPVSWLGKTTLDDEAMNTCNPNEWLLVEAWDES